MTLQTTKVVKKEQKTSHPKSDSSDDQKLTTKVLQSFDEAVAVSEQLNATVQQLESATKSQTSGIEEVSQSIQSIATAIQGVASNATKAMEMMRQSEQITQNISADANKGMEKMTNMKAIVSESSNDVKTLAKELNKVDNMTGFITQIAEQTNLLALNAAIEAARAGDVGRGFAVVADEVRRLAENSKKGAEDISHLISSLKESSSKTTESIEKGNSLVQESYDMITNILKSIKDISNSITEVVTQMQDISAATEQVSSGTEEATAASEEILAVAQTNLKSFEEIVLAKNKETQILHDANISARTLAEITDVLDTSTIVSITDADGMIEYMNKQFLTVAKYHSEELMGESHRLLKSGWHDPGLFDALWSTITAGKMFQGYVRNRSKDGTIYWVKTAISPTFDEHGKIKGYVGVRTPITELMVMTGIEDAIREEEAGKSLSDPKLKPLLDQLRTGAYKVYDNY
jgi:PAS domain S-box-containing protein